MKRSERFDGRWVLLLSNTTAFRKLSTCILWSYQRQEQPNCLYKLGAFVVHLHTTRPRGWKRTCFPHNIIYLFPVWFFLILGISHIGISLHWVKYCSTLSWLLSSSKTSPHPAGSFSRSGLVCYLRLVLNCYLSFTTQSLSTMLELY